MWVCAGVPLLVDITVTEPPPAKVAKFAAVSVTE